MSYADELEFLLEYMSILCALTKQAEDAKDWKLADQHMNALLDIEDRYLTVDGRMSCD